MAYYLRQVSDLTVNEIQKLHPTQLPMLFADDLNPDDPPAKIALWLDSIKEPEYSPTSYRYVMWEDDEFYARASVLISPFEGDWRLGILQCRFDADSFYGGVATALCQKAIDIAFNHGNLNLIAAHAALDDHMLQKVFSTIPMTENPAGAETNNDCLNRDVLTYEFRADDPVRLTWDPDETLNWAKDCIAQGSNAAYTIHCLMESPKESHIPFLD
jgi:hypothetical protein